MLFNSRFNPHNIFPVPVQISVSKIIPTFHSKFSKKNRYIYLAFQFLLMTINDQNTDRVTGETATQPSKYHHTRTTHTHTRLTALYPGLPGTIKAKTNLNFTEARDSEWQWHQLGHMQVCTSLQTANNASTSPLCFLQAGCPSCRPTNSVNAGQVVC